MREPSEVSPPPVTEVEILRHGLREISLISPGGHADPTNPCYRVKRDFKEYAQRILDAGAEAKKGKGD